MKYRAKIGFCGTPLSMGIGEVKEITSVPEKIVSELVRLRYIEPVNEEADVRELTGDGTGEALPETKAENAAEEKAEEPIKTEKPKRTKTAK